jgi:hypothetical protein
MSVHASRSDGCSIHYRIVDPCVTGLLDMGLCLTEDAKSRRASFRIASLATGSPSPGAGQSF